MADAARGVKRFYEHVAVTNGLGITIDGKPVRTPGRTPLVLPTRALAEAVAAEWAAQGEMLDPRTMRLTGLANVALDRVAPDPAAFAADLAKYAESDLLCYRAENPAALVTAQGEAWDTLLDWASRRYDVAFTVTHGIVHQAQPRRTIESLGAATAAHDVFALAGLSPLVTIGGSLIAALALAERAFDPDDVWTRLTVDERWQAEQWGADDEATRSLSAREAEFMSAARFLALI